MQKFLDEHGLRHLLGQIAGTGIVTRRALVYGEDYTITVKLDDFVLRGPSEYDGECCCDQDPVCCCDRPPYTVGELAIAFSVPVGALDEFVLNGKVTLDG